MSTLPADCVCSLCSFTGASGPAERARDLATAKEDGRREAFREAFIEAGTRQYDFKGLREWLDGKARGKP